jgi:hypothetical protein
MNDPIAATETKPITNTELPLSIKLIGWYYILIMTPLVGYLGVIIATVVMFVVFLGEPDIFWESHFVFGRRLVVQDLFLLPFILLALVPLFAGIGLFRKRKLAWYVALSLILLVLSAIIEMAGSMADINLIILVFIFIVNLLVVWKLIQHRRIFGI